MVLKTDQVNLDTQMVLQTAFQSVLLQSVLHLNTEPTVELRVPMILILPNLDRLIYREDVGYRVFTLG